MKRFVATIGVCLIMAAFILPASAAKKVTISFWQAGGYREDAASIRQVATGFAGQNVDTDANLVGPAVGSASVVQAPEDGSVLGFLVNVGKVSSGSSAYADQLRAYRFANFLLRQDFDVFWLAEPLEYAGRRYEEGSFFVPVAGISLPGRKIGPDAVVRIMERLAGELAVGLEPVKQGTPLPAAVLAYRLKKQARLAIYQGDRTYSGPGDVASALEAVGVYPRYLTATEIRQGALKAFDTLVMPGGSQDVQAYALGPRGMEQLRAFVEAGGDYLGLCAGAYLAYRTAYGLTLIDASSAGRGTVGSKIEVRQREGGHPVFYGYDSVIPGFYYGGGPNFEPSEGAVAFLNEVPETWKNKDLRGTAPFLEGMHGLGKVLLIGPHPENSMGPEGMYGMPRLFGNAVFYLESEGPEQVAIIGSALPGWASPNLPSGEVRGGNGVDPSSFAERVRALKSAIGEMQEDVVDVWEITKRLDEKTDPSKFFWNFCYFGWTMKEPVKRVRELPARLSELEEQYARLIGINDELAAGCAVQAEAVLASVEQDILSLQPVWSKIAQDMAQIERDVDALLQKEKEGVSTTDLDWWRLNIREYLVAVELVGGLNWKYWVSEDSTEETPKSGWDESAGEPLHAVRASTERGAIGTLTAAAMRLNEVLETNRFALACADECCEGQCRDQGAV